MPLPPNQSQPQGLNLHKCIALAQHALFKNRQPDFAAYNDYHRSLKRRLRNPSHYTEKEYHWMEKEGLYVLRDKGDDWYELRQERRRVKRVLEEIQSQRVEILRREKERLQLETTESVNAQ
ncbi:MAG: hypothetical protein Q9159_000317 [Coniocarpon cinnabarinum]